MSFSLWKDIFKKPQKPLTVDFILFKNVIWFGCSQMWSGKTEIISSNSGLLQVGEAGTTITVY